jgi:hypothetical protein
MTDVRMLSYADAAKALGIKVDSVKRRARNRRWKREAGNDGTVRIGVPLDALPSADNPADNPRDIVRLEKMVSALEAEVRMLRETQDELRADRDAWRNMSQRSWWQRIIGRHR